MYYKYVRPQILKKKLAYINGDRTDLYLIKLIDGLTEEEYNEDTDIALPMGNFYATLDEGVITPVERNSGYYGHDYTIAENSDEADYLWYDREFIGPYLSQQAFRGPYHMFIYSEMDDVLEVTFGDYDESTGMIDDCVS